MAGLITKATWIRKLFKRNPRVRALKWLNGERIHPSTVEATLSFKEQRSTVCLFIWIGSKYKLKKDLVWQMQTFRGGDARNKALVFLEERQLPIGKVKVTMAYDRAKLVVTVWYVGPVSSG